jgi:hypothetical protein
MNDSIVTSDEISIVIPSIGNRGIFELLRSIHADTSLGAHEILIVCNSKTITALLDLSREHTCIKFIEQNIMSVSISRNLGISSSKYEQVSLIDDDDEWAHGRARHLVGALQANPRCIVFGSTRLFDQKSKHVTFKIRDQIIKKENFSKQFKRQIFLKQKYFLQVGNCIFNKTQVRPRFRENLNYLEDQIWILESLNSGVCIKQISNVTLNYNFSRARSSHRWSIVNEKNVWSILNNLSPKLGDKYIANVSLKSLAIDLSFVKFKEAKKDVKQNFSLNLNSKIKILFLTILNLALSPRVK